MEPTQARPNTFLHRLFGRRHDNHPDFSGMNPEQTHQAIMASMVRDMLAERRSDRRWRTLRRSLTAILLLTIIGTWLYTLFYEPSAKPLVDGAQGQIGIVRITGEISSSSKASAEKVIPALQDAFAAEKVKAVVLAIDSPGGAPVEAERINFAVDQLKQRYNKPVYAVIQNLGASAAYMIAMHTDKVYAGHYSLVGSIGAVLHAWDMHEALDRHDVHATAYASGMLKNMLNPFTAPTAEAGKKAQDLVNAAGAAFFNEFRQRRGARLKPGVQYDTGEVWSGGEAQQLGLIDEIGTIEKLAIVNKATVREFGPGRRNGSPLSAEAIGQWLSTVVSEGLRAALAEQSGPRLD